MTQTITITKSEFEKLIKRIESLEKKLAEFMKGEPAYGSPEWWEKEEAQADEDFKKGRYTTFNSISELRKYLSGLK